MLKKEGHEETLPLVKSAKDARAIYRANALNLRHKGLSASEVRDFLEITPRTVLSIQSNYESDGHEKALYDDQG